MEEDLRLATLEEIEELKAKLDRLTELIERDKLAINKLLKRIEARELYLKAHLSITPQLKLGACKSP